MYIIDNCREDEKECCAKGFTGHCDWQLMACNVLFCSCNHAFHLHYDAFIAVWRSYLSPSLREKRGSNNCVYSTSICCCTYGFLCLWYTAWQGIISKSAPQTQVVSSSRTGWPYTPATEWIIMHQLLCQLSLAAHLAAQAVTWQL